MQQIDGVVRQFWLVTVWQRVYRHCRYDGEKSCTSFHTSQLAVNIIHKYTMKPMPNPQNLPTYISWSFWLSWYLQNTIQATLLFSMKTQTIIHVGYIFLIKPVTTKELKPSTRCNIFLVETANMANHHHTGFEVYIHVWIFFVAPLKNTSFRVFHSTLKLMYWCTTETGFLETQETDDDKRECFRSHGVIGKRFWQHFFSCKDRCEVIMTD